MRSTTGLFLGASALLGASCVNGLAEEVFAAIDKQNDGLRTVNKEVSHDAEMYTNIQADRATDLGEPRARVQGGSRP